MQEMIKLMTLMLSLYAAAASAQEFSFQDAVQEMLGRNPRLAQAQMQSDASRSQQGQAKAGYLPQVDFIQSWTYSDNPVFAFSSLLNQQQFSAADFSMEAMNHPDPLSDVSSQVQLGWLIYDFGKRESRIAMAGSGYRISVLQQDRTRLSLLQELVRRYYAVSLAAQRSSVADDALTSAGSRLEQARNRASQGLAVRSDELSAEVFRAGRLQEKIEAENQQKLAVAALKEILGREDEEILQTADLKERAFADEPLSFWLQEMKQRRPELQIAAEASHIAHSQLRVDRSAFLPAIQAWSNVQWHGETFHYTGDNWAVGLELRWNLFRGFADREQLAAARMLEQSSRESRRETENALQLQLKQAYYHFQTAKEKLAVSSAMVAQATESKRIYADRYASGMVSIQDLLQAETACKESRLMHAQNLYELYVAFAELLGAAGKGDEIEKMEVR